MSHQFILVLPAFSQRGWRLIRQESDVLLQVLPQIFPAPHAAGHGAIKTCDGGLRRSDGVDVCGSWGFPKRKVGTGWMAKLVQINPITSSKYGLWYWMIQHVLRTTVDGVYKPIYNWSILESSNVASVWKSTQFLWFSAVAVTWQLWRKAGPVSSMSCHRS